MSFHNKPKYQIPSLIADLMAHKLPHDTASQLADSFRIGWLAGYKAAQAPQPAPPANSTQTNSDESKKHDDTRQYKRQS